MITSARIDALKDLGGLSWITCRRAPTIKALADLRAAKRDPIHA